MINQKVCSIKEPLGIDCPPVFSWVVQAADRGEQQSAYRIVVASTAEKAAAKIGDFWDSGKVTSEETMEVVYGGKALPSCTTCYWTVEVWNSAGSKEQGLAERFSTGILNPDQWHGKWIGRERKSYTLDLTGGKWIWRRDDAAFHKVPAGVQYFRRSFTPAAGKTVEQAAVSWAADDKAIFYFNGEDMGKTNTWTAGGLKDVTSSVRAGKNTAAFAVENLTEGYAGLVAKVQIRYTDGSGDTILSDGNWKVSQSRQEGWQYPEYEEGGWLAPDQMVDFGGDPWKDGIQPELWDDREAVLLRKDFQVSREVREAYAYVCGLGFFELTVNGRLPDDSLLNPFPTEYNKTVLYRTFDVTRLLKQGGNALGVELGNSYYNEIGGVWNWPTASWRDAPKLMLQLEIRYTDGTSELVTSQPGWKITNNGPIISNSMYYGETYDARKEQTGFSEYGFDESGWETALVVNPPAGKLKAHMKAPVKRVASFRARNIKKLANGSYVVTGQEMTAGWIKLMNINEKAGHKITLTYGQALNPDGTVIKWGGADGKVNYWWPHAYIQQDHYIAKGTGNECFEPKFSYKGHQYIQIDGFSGELTAEDLVIYRVSNNLDTVGSFESSNPMLNQLHHMMVTAMANNFQGEHCDPLLEKNGWLGDANVSLGSLMYNFDMTGSLPGWIDVLEDCFQQYGTVPVMAPTADWWIDNTPVWNTLFVYGVKELENYYGQTGYAARQYDVMGKFARKDIHEIQQNGWVWHDSQLADWVAPIGGSNPNAPYNENVSEGSGIAGTAYVYGVLDYLANLADRLGRPADAAEYRQAMEKIYDAFQNTFWKEDLGYYQTNFWSQIGQRTRYRQASNLVPLAFGLVPEERKDRVIASLVRDIREKDCHLDTGCVGTRYFLPILCDYGYEDVAYQIVTQTTYPSWGFWIEKGATSTWEMWEATTRSYDHYFLGTYDEWFFSHLAGIRDMKAGYKTFKIQPSILGDLKEVKARIDTPRGRLDVHWILQEDGSVAMDVTVPFGSTGEIVLPAARRLSVKLEGGVLSDSADGVRSVTERDGRVVVTVGSGAYSFTVWREGVLIYE